MKKLILFLVLGIVLVSFVGSVNENCEIATPRYGVVQCVNIHQEEPKSVSFSCSDNKCSTSIPCLSNCHSEIAKSSLFGDGSCPLGYLRTYNIIKDGDSLGEITSISWNREISLVVKAYCKLIGIDSFKPINDYYPNSKFNYAQDKIMLEEEWAGSLPDNFIEGTDDCIVNKNYESPAIDAYFNPSTGQNENKPSSTHSSINQFPYNWKIGDHFIFIKDWQTNIADISLTYDKDNNAFWCGGQYGSRKIYDVKKIISSTGRCYVIPQSIKIENAECCFPIDCINNFGAEYTCNPSGWKCEKTKPCNSQIECESTFGEGICQNNQINQWVCDLTKTWGNYAGTCIHSSKQVFECPSDCSSKEYYNEEEGKCLSRANLKGEGIDDLSITGRIAGVSQKSSSTGRIILVIFLILIGSSIAYFVYTKNKKTKLKKKVKKDLKEKGKHCTKCGNLLGPNNKFCTKCGKRV